MGQSHEWIAEDALAAALNVPREELRKRRPYLRAGEVDQKNGAVLWLTVAAERIAAELGIPYAPAEKNAPEANGAPAEAVETLTVVSRAVNPNIVNARRPNGEMAAVRVTDNRKFVPQMANGTPMTFAARKSTAGNWWLMVGREPRWPGIW